MELALIFWRNTELLLGIALVAVLAACSPEPLTPYATKAGPVPQEAKSLIGLSDERARFREIFCQVLDARGNELPDYRPCEVALTRVGQEPSGAGHPVSLGYSAAQLKALFVPGIGWDCFSEWLEPPGTAVQNIRRFGFDFVAVPVEALSSSAQNAKIIRNTVLAETQEEEKARLVLIGYSKGTPDILEAIETYPEIRTRVAAVVSIGGAVGGSPLANEATQSNIAPLRYFPGANCTRGDGGGIESLRPEARKAWLAEHQLPKGIKYYSLVSLPDPKNVSTLLKPSFRKLSRIDRANDGQLIYYDQFIPNSDFLGYLNADHWALAVPVARSHENIGQVFVNRNAFPREALLEAVFRFVEEGLNK